MSQLALGRVCLNGQGVFVLQERIADLGGPIEMVAFACGDDSGGLGIGLDEHPIDIDRAVLELLMRLLDGVERVTVADFLVPNQTSIRFFFTCSFVASGL